MNDFTKEELEIIKHGVDWVFEHQDFKDKSSVLILGRKIQSMIDNYCEHDKRPYESYVTGFQEKCCKCDKVFEDE